MNKIDLIIDALNEKDGVLYWAKPNASQIKVGSKAGSVNSEGYVLVKFHNKNYSAHQIIFYMHHGYSPKFLDHIDGNRANNKIKNLRSVTLIENRCNSKMQSNNTSGIKGVSKYKDKWRVQVRLNGKMKYSSYFADIELAELVAIEARNKYHGEFANHD